MAEDYYRAMRSVEQRLELAAEPEEPVNETERAQLLTLTEELVRPEVSQQAMQVIVAQIRLVLLGEKVAREASP